MVGFSLLNFYSGCWELLCLLVIVVAALFVVADSYAKLLMLIVKIGEGIF